MPKEPLYEADPNCKQCKGTGSVLFDSEAGREYDDCECLKEFICEECSKPLSKDDDYHKQYRTCNSYCYGKMVGVYS